MSAVAATEPQGSGPPVHLHLHLPEADETRRLRWRDQVLAGAPLAEVLSGDEGLAEWLWARWRVLERAGIDRGAFVALVVAYRRECWLWLYGDRTWEQCCAGLLGRIERRLAR